MRHLVTALLVVLFLSPLPALGQAGAGQGVIGGTVTDQAGAVIVGATVTARNAETQLERVAKTSEGGYYVFTNLPPGPYDVVFELAGFAKLVRSGVVVMTGQRVTLDAQLRVSPAQETVTVTGEVALVETESTESKAYVGETEIDNLPINGRRWDNFVLLTPAVTTDGDFGLISYRGISGLYNNNMIDGADNNQAFFSEARGRTRIAYAISQSTIREFQVGKSNYSAEFGRAAGGLVNAVTRSGTNDLRGEFFYYIRDNALGARNPTINSDPILSARGLTKPEDRRQQFGASLSGPLVRNRLFWFLNYDQQARNFPAAILTASPTFLDSTGTAPALAASKAFFATRVTTQDRKGDQYIGLGKVDWQINSNHLLSSTVNVMRWDSPNGIQTQATHTNDVSANGTDGVHDEYLISRLSSVLSPALVNEGRFQYGRDFNFQTANAPGPSVGITGGINMGMPNFLPREAFPNEKRFQWVDNLSWASGRHNVKVGFDVNHVRDLMVNLFQGGGVYSYPSLNNFALDCTTPSFPFSCSGTPGQEPVGKHYTNFTQGFDSTGQRGRLDFSTTDYSFYAQNNMKVLPSLTLQLGVRYEYQSIPQPSRASALDARTGRINVDRNNFGPRVGFSWDPFGSRKTVIRGGYGLFYGRTQNSTISNFLTNNGELIVSYFFTPTTADAPVFPNVFANIPTGTASRPDLVVASPDYANPIIHQFEFSIEREVLPRLSVSVSYLGSRGQRLPYFRDANLFAPTDTVLLTVDCSPNPGNAACQNAPAAVAVPFYRGPSTNRPNPAVGRITLTESVVNQWYNGFVLQVRRRMGKGFTLQASLTVAKAQDNGQSSQTFSTGNQPLDPNNLRAEYALGNLDQRKRFVLSMFWQPSFASLNNTALRALINGFKFSTVVTLSDGRPVTAFVSGSTAAPGLSALGSGPLAVSGASRAPWLARNSFITPGQANVDFRLAREFGFTERVRLELMGEAFNLFNRTNVTSVFNTAFNLSGTRLTARNDFLADRGTANTIYRERQVQLGLRLRF